MAIISDDSRIGEVDVKQLYVQAKLYLRISVCSAVDSKTALVPSAVVSTPLHNGSMRFTKADSVIRFQVRRQHPAHPNQSPMLHGIKNGLALEL